MKKNKNIFKCSLSVLFGLILFSSCNNTNQKKSISVSKENQDNISNAKDTVTHKTSVINNKVIDILNKVSITNLPVHHKLELLKSKGYKYTSEGFECYNLEKSYPLLDQIASEYQIKDTIAYDFPINDFEPFEIKDLHFVKRLEPINNIELLLFCSYVNYEGGGALFILLSYDKINNKILDDKIVSIFGHGQDNWSYFSGFYINSNYNIISVSHTTEESIYDLHLRELEVDSTGVINTVMLNKIDALKPNEFFKDIKNRYKFLSSSNELSN